MVINLKKIYLAVILLALAPFQVSADEVTEVIDDVAAKLVQQLPMDKKIALKSLSPDETGLPEDFLRKLTSDLEAALLTASDFQINIANRATMEDVWQEAVEFNNADFDELFKSANADVMLMMSPRAISTGVEVAITAYSLTGNDVGQIVASSGTVLLPIDLQLSLGVDILTLNQQVNTIIERIDTSEVQSPIRADVIYKRFLGASVVSNDLSCAPDIKMLECFEDKIVAIVNGKKYVVHSSDHSKHKVIFSGDLDNDGFADALIESHNGAAAMPSSYNIVSYRGEGRFKEFDLDVWTAEQPRVLQEGVRWVVRVQQSSFGAGNTAVSDEITEFRIVDGNLDERSVGSRAFEFAIATFTSAEAIEHWQYNWNFDFDADERDEVLQCSVWKRWGVLKDCYIYDEEASWAVVHSDPTYSSSGGAQCKVISVLEEKNEGFHKLMCDFDDLILKKSDKKIIAKNKIDTFGCAISAATSKIVNFQNFTNLRQQAGLNGRIVGRVALGETVQIVKPGNYLRYDHCAAACNGTNQNAIKQCIDNNDVWIEVQYKGRRGFLSRKFLE